MGDHLTFIPLLTDMIAAYGPHAASATGGNALARDFLSGVAALYSAPFYQNIPGKFSLEIPSTILGGLALLVTIPIYVFYTNGPKIRKRSKYAQSLADSKSDKKKSGEKKTEDEQVENA